ncbi:MAG: DUF4232 domain-containing protein [Actinobacteria bacterium]|nr:DUF4232 domain-containing protein [Actinomycetota bacterium]
MATATPSGSVTSAAPTTTAPSRSAGPTATTTARPAPSTAPATTGPCPTRSLQAKLGRDDGAAGSIYTAINFTNISKTTCVLHGYPGVALAGGTPVTQIGLAAAKDTAVPATDVTLAPGSTGHAILRIAQAGNYSPSECHPVTAQYLQIYPPKQTTPIYLPHSAEACSAPIQILYIRAIEPGTG